MNDMIILCFSDIRHVIAMYFTELFFKYIYKCDFQNRSEKQNLNMVTKYFVVFRRLKVISFQRISLKPD